MTTRSASPSPHAESRMRIESSPDGFPQAITNHGASAVLEISWSDGSRSLLAHGLLRASCRCAACVAQRRMDKPAATAPSPIRLDHIELIGQQGLNLVFSDGHGRGIFPWSYLRELSATQP